MQLKIIFFGQLTDHTNTNSIIVNDIADTEGLVKLIAQLYPSMADVTYRIAVDKKIVQANTLLNDKNEVALLPPFSGG